jgi:type I restriction enzyme S subunit
MKGWPELGSECVVGDDSESVRQLRKLIVVLAMSGRLSADSDIGVDGQTIAGKIDAAKRLLVATGHLSRCEAMAVVAPNDLPDVLPSSAHFVRLSSIAKVEKGLTGIQQAAPGPFPLVVTAEGRARCDHFDFDGAAAIVPLVSSAGHGKASLQRLHYQEGKFALGSILAACFPYVPELVSARFLYEYLTAFKDELLVSQMIGTANVTLSIGKVSNVPVPLLTPTVQRRVDELMALCDRLEAARAEREAVRDRLTAASLSRLNTPDPKTFREDARFVLDALSALTARPSQIKQFRETVLNLAVLGKLVAQDDGDEPAALLLASITGDTEAFRTRHRLGSIDVEPVDDQDAPLALPKGWIWVRLASLFKIITDGDHQPPPKSDKGVAFLTIGNVTTGRLDFSGCRHVPIEYFKSLAPYRVPKKGDILYTVVGATFGRPALVETERDFCVQRHIAILKPVAGINTRFLVWLLSSPLVYDQAARSTTGTAQPTIALRPLRNFLVPLPPLREQNRMVAKIDAMMVLCDLLEASRVSANEHRRCLLESLLHKALEPVDLEMEAT